MRNSLRLGIIGAAALGLAGLVGSAQAADLVPGDEYAPPPPRYSYPAPAPYERSQVEVERDGPCRSYVRHSVDPYGRERVRRVEECDEGRTYGYYRGRYEDEAPYAPRPPAPIDPDDDGY